MAFAHYYALVAGYGTAVVAWLLVARFFPQLWPRQKAVALPRPWREVALALLAVLGVLAIGQLYVRAWLLPACKPLAPVIDAANQMVIFSPILALPLLRRQGLRTAWIKTDRIWLRLLIGFVLAAVAIVTFTSVRPGSDNWWEVYPRVYRPKNVGLLVQVFCEDVAIAVLFVRLRAAIGLWGTIALVAFLFAAAHIPAMVATGASRGEFARLVMDVGLGTMVLFIAQRSVDIWWLWCVHFAMDMTQFVAVPPSVA